MLSFAIFTFVFRLQQLQKNCTFGNIVFSFSLRFPSCLSLSLLVIVFLFQIAAILKPEPIYGLMKNRFDDNGLSVEGAPSLKLQ